MTVHIQIKSINEFSDAQYMDIFKFLEEQRKESVRNMTVEKDKKRSIVAGYLIDRIAHKFDCKKEDLKKTDNGKLFFVSELAPVFNVSHSGEYVILAYVLLKETLGDVISQEVNGELGSEVLLGVDIQEIRKMKQGMAKRILNLKETMSEDQLYLNRIWSAKEAYVKMTGSGLATDFRQLRVDFEAMICMDEEEERVGYLYEVNVGDKYFAYVCTSKCMDTYEIE